MPRGYVFGGLYRMFLYHESYPFQYIALITAIYAVLGTVLIRLARGLRGKNQFIAIVGLQFATVVVASIPGGMLWELHDMQAGYFPEGSRMWYKLAGGAWTGLQIGWLIIGLSIPYNILGLTVGFWITKMGFRFNGGKLMVKTLCARSSIMIGPSGWRQRLAATSPEMSLLQSSTRGRMGSWGFTPGFQNFAPAGRSCRVHSGYIGNSLA